VLAGQSCQDRYYVSGFDSTGKIICQPVRPPCAGESVDFKATSHEVDGLEAWTGGSLTERTSSGCLVTVEFPEGTIDLIGGTAGTSGWKITDVTGTSLVPTGTIHDPNCGSVAAVPETNKDDFPTCTTASVPALGLGSQSTDVFTVSVPQ
jgi:hypothetical protein